MHMTELSFGRQLPSRQRLGVNRPTPAITTAECDGQIDRISKVILNDDGPRAICIDESCCLKLAARSVIVATCCSQIYSASGHETRELAHQVVIECLGVGPSTCINLNESTAAAASSRKMGTVAGITT
jgi:hypothetical protein